MSTDKGNCDFCESKDVIIINCHNLGVVFEQLFGLYTNHPTSKKSLDKDEPFLLHQHLTKFWGKLFNLHVLNEKEIKQLVNQIGRGTNLFSEELFEQPVEIGVLLGRAASPAEDLSFKWDYFAEEIKSKNRFFLSEKIDTEDLKSVFERLSFTYPKGTVFYRARISDEKLRISKMGKPPRELTTPGRANPVGIPYLYLSESEKTTLYETRVALHEGITIGKFIANEPLSLVSLKNIADYGPFEIIDRGFSFEEFITYRPYLIKLENELSKPVRKEDVHLDYLPTQFLCEFIKSFVGFDAVEYKSGMNANGYNLAVFNDSKLSCIKASFYKVRNLEYTWV